MPKSLSTYKTEQQLVDVFCAVLESETSPWGKVALVREFGYIRGCTDVVAVDHRDQVLAFEAKLSRWRDALHQAYRNTCFAHLSYVFVPLSAAKRAVQYSYEFAVRRVGLCYAEQGQIIVCIPATLDDPIQPWLSKAAVAKTKEYQL